MIAQELSQLEGWDEWAEGMAFAVPQYSRKRVNEAGDALIRLHDTAHAWGESEIAAYIEAHNVINNWRASHSGPLLHIRMLLSRQAKSIDKNALIAQRIKRLSSIELKLRRFPTMKLSQMQDIGGCRAVVGSVQEVRRLADSFGGSRTQNELHHTDNYITTAQPTGYRGIHLNYRFRSSTLSKCSGLRIEVQLRSPLQHAWATAVETVGTFTRQALKSSQGQRQWLRFFELMGSVVAFKEDTPLVINTPTNTIDLISEVAKFESQLQVRHSLESFRLALREFDKAGPNAAYYLLELDPSAGSLTVNGFTARELFRATEIYAETEKRIAQIGGDAVLVSVDSLTSLRRAYPNYFLDTRVLLDLLEETLERGI